MNSIKKSYFSTVLELLEYRASDVSGTADTTAFTYLGDGENISGKLTFCELARRAKIVAAHLQQCCQPGDRVLLVYPPSLDYIVAFYGCVYAGVIAVPALPPANVRTFPRLQLIAQESTPRAVLGPSAIAAKVHSYQADCGELFADLAWITTDDLSDLSADWRAPDSQASDIVFLQYTSGSTGTPKGVMVSHGNLLANVELSQAVYGIRSDDVFVSWLPPHHDFGLVGGIVFPVFVGCHCVQFPPAAFMMRPFRWLKALSDYRARMTGAPNFAYELCSDKIDQSQKRLIDLSPLEVAVNGAERVRHGTITRFLDAFAECGLRAGAMTPAYGLAESTLLVAANAMRARDAMPRCLSLHKAGLAAGLAVADDGDADSLEILSTGLAEKYDHQTIIVDPSSCLRVADEVVGEIWLRGPSVASGYWRRPEDSAATFGATVVGSSLPYLRTGDLGFIRRGELYVVGRIKEMMVFNGRNVYPQDIEASTEQLDEAFRANGCAAFSVDAGNRTGLVLVQEIESRRTPRIESLLSTIREDLAERHELFDLHAVVLVKAGRLPRTSSGKIQRGRCRELFLAGQFDCIWSWKADRQAGASSAAYAAPVTRIEQEIAAIWHALFNVAKIGVHDDFFKLGGHSLLATQLVSRIRNTFDVELTLRALFDAPTVAALALKVASAQRVNTSPIMPVDRTAVLPLSFAQQRLWFLQKMDPGSTAYNMPGAVRMRGPLDVAALRSSLQELVVRHEILRTNFVEDGSGQAYLSIRPQLELPLEVEAASEGDIAHKRQAHASHRFDLSSGPLLTAKLLQLSDDEHVLLVNMHHIISDGWSVSILCNEWMQLYEAKRAGQASPLPALPFQYADYAHWQRGPAQTALHDSQLRYWTAQLDGASDLLNLPTDRPRPPIQQFEGASETLDLDGDLACGLRALAQDEGASLFMILQAGFAVLMSRHSGDRDLQIGTPAVNRDRQGLEGLLGLFVGTLVIRTNLQGHPSFRELLGRVRQTALDAYANNDVPFERIVDAMSLQRDLSRNPLFQVFFNMLNLPQPDLQRRELQLDMIEDEEGVHVGSKFDITLYAKESAHGIHLHLNYNKGLFDAERIRELLRQYAVLLRQVADTPDGCIDDYCLITDWARRVLPDPRVPLDNRWVGAVHELFVARQLAQPQAMAIVSHECSWRYQELHQHSERIACFLQSHGVGRGDIVAIHASRNATLVAAVFGVLMSGAAYMMLDPTHPAGHLEQCLDVAPPQAWLQVYDGPMDEDKLRIAARVPVQLDLRDIANSVALLTFIGQRVQPTAVSADDVAAITFTSGSTGKPKAVEGLHGPLSHFLPWMADQFGVTVDDRFSMLSGLAHDPLQRDMFTSLCLGASLHIPHPDEISPGRLRRWLHAHRITVTNLTPAMAQYFPETAEECALDELRFVVLAGDVLTRRDVRRLQCLGSGVRIVSFYGSTETQRSFGYYEISRETEVQMQKEVIPLGRGIPGVQLLVLNGRGRQAGIGEQGEVYMRSAHLARGYRGEPEMTATRFIANPFGTGPDDRLYRSGDLGRYLLDGMVECLGRADTQVKLRGFRIELGHIESVLGQHPRIGAAIAAVRSSTNGENHLVAYVVPSSAVLLPAQLRDYLRDKLPPHMQPSLYMMLDALPLTPNGKVDRKALPEPSFDSSEVIYLAPRSASEQKMVEIWSDLLQVGQIGVNHNFFDLGGHSLLATRLASRIVDAFNVELSLHSIFRAGTVAEMAVLVDAVRSSGHTSALAHRPIVKIDRRRHGTRPVGAESHMSADAAK